MNDLTLSDIATQINTEHARVQSAIREGLQHALKCGELLAQAKALVNHGEWLPWLSKNCAVSERTAQAYMRVFQNWPELSKSATVADLTYRGALALLADPFESPEVQPGSKEELGVIRKTYEALKEIRDKKLYRNSHLSFEAYCRDRWNIENINDLMKVWDDSGLFS